MKQLWRCLDIGRASSARRGTNLIRGMGGKVISLGSFLSTSQPCVAADSLQLQIHPKQKKKKKFTQSLLCEMNVVPLNTFPLPAGTMLRFVSRGHRRKGFCFSVLVKCVCLFPAPAPVPRTTSLWLAASSFPSHPTQKIWQQNASSETPPCEQLFLPPQRADFWQVPPALHRSDFSTIE